MASAAAKLTLTALLSHLAVFSAASQECEDGKCKATGHGKSGDNMLQKRTQFEKTIAQEHVMHSRASEVGYECGPGMGQVGKVLKIGGKVQISKDNSAEACGAFCTRTPGCKGIDVTLKKLGNSCRLYGDNTPRSQVGNQKRQYCKKVEAPTIIPVTRPNPPGLTDANVEFMDIDYYDPEYGDVELDQLPPKAQSKSAAPRSSKLSSLKHPLETADYNPVWIGENPWDGLVKMEEVEYTDGVLADLAIPQCAPPAEGFKSVIIVPGRKNVKYRHTWQAWLFARRGVVALNLDIKKRMPDMKSAVQFLKDAAYAGKYPIDPNGIVMMGYSLGANASLAHNLGGTRNTVAGHIQAAGIGCDVAVDWTVADAPPLLSFEARNDAFKRPTRGGFFNKHCAKHLSAGEKVWDKVWKWMSSMHAATGHAHLVAYETGSHQPVLNNDFHAEAVKFIKSPLTYKPPIVDWHTALTAKPPTYHIGCLPATWKQSSTNGKGCTTETKNLETLLQSDGLMGAFGGMWGGSNGMIGCMSVCKQVSGCVGVDIFKSAVAGIQCALFNKVCEDPANSKSTFYVWEGHEFQGDDGTCSEVSSHDTWVPPEMPEGSTSQGGGGGGGQVAEEEEEEIDEGCTPTGFFTQDEACPAEQEITTQADCELAVIDDKVFKATNKKNSWLTGCYLDTRNNKGVYWNKGTGDNEPKSYQKYVCKMC